MQSAEIARESFPEEWQSAFESLENLPDGGVCLVVGSPNRGRSAFALRTAGILSGNGQRIAVVDADIASSELGLPGTVTAAWAAPNARRLQELSPVAEYFIGSFSPERAGLELTSSVARAVAWTKFAGATRIIVVLPGTAFGAAGRRLMSAIAATIAPELMLAFCKDTELQDILSIAAALCPSATVLRVGSPLELPPFSQAQRDLVQSARLVRAFGQGSELRFPLGDQGGERVYTLNTPLGTAEALPPHLIRWIAQTLRCEVIRAEIIRGQHIDLYVGEKRQNGRSGADVDQSIVAEHFGVRAVRHIQMARLVHSYLGLIDEKGKLAGVGRFVGIDAAADEMIVASAVSANRQIRIVQFGRARISENGSVLETS